MIDRLQAVLSKFEERKSPENMKLLLSVAEEKWDAAEISDEEYAKYFRQVAYWLEFN